MRVNHGMLSFSELLNHFTGVTFRNRTFNFTFNQHESKLMSLQRVMNYRKTSMSYVWKRCVF